MVSTQKRPQELLNGLSNLTMRHYLILTLLLFTLNMLINIFKLACLEWQNESTTSSVMGLLRLRHLSFKLTLRKCGLKRMPPLMLTWGPRLSRFTLVMVFSKMYRPYHGSSNRMTPHHFHLWTQSTTYGLESLGMLLTLLWPQTRKEKPLVMQREITMPQSSLTAHQSLQHQGSILQELTLWPLQPLMVTLPKLELLIGL